MTNTQTRSEQAPDRPEGSGRRVILFAGLVVAGIAIVVVAATAGARLFGAGSAWDVEPGQPVQVTIEPGSSATTIYRTLHDAGVAPSGALRGVAQSAGVEDTLQAGVYALATDMDAEAVIAQLVAGSNTSGGAGFTVVEGWTIQRIVEELATSTGTPQADFEAALSDGLVTSVYLPGDEVAVDAIGRWEGLLYPATYVLPSNGDPIAILGTMADEAVSRFDAIDWSRIDALGVSRYEALIIASLIEREAGTDDERNEIASVIHNRLGQGMRLQIDATVIYALGYNPGRVTAADLEVESPYNTYRVDGLPPTPIGSSSIASLEAAVDPASTAFLFYVLANADGSHLFAETYEGHQLNIATASENGVRP